MNSYLDLVKEYAKKHKNKNRMSLFVILLAVALVATIFGMADMEMQTQQRSMKKQYGNWHINIRDISGEQAELLALRPQAALSGYVGVTGGLAGYLLDGKAANIMGADEQMAGEIGIRLTEGRYPQNAGEAVLTASMAQTLGIEAGDKIEIKKPDGGRIPLTITALAEDTAAILKTDQAGIVMTIQGFYDTIPPEDYTERFYIQFKPFTNIQEEKGKIEQAFGISQEQIQDNVYLLAAMGQSGDSYFLAMYGTAVILFLFVLIAAVLMISSSFQTSVSERIRFFGMLRCLGASRKQIKRFVIKEGLTYCKKAIPAGAAVGILVIWGLSGLLRGLSPEYFADMPVFGFSIPGILAGAAVGIASCLLASLSPAKKAAAVSPLTAVSGNAGKSTVMNNTRMFGGRKIDSTLGIYHALENRKNLVLMVASFAFSILMFMSFSGLIDFMNHAIRPLRPWSPDISLISADNSCSIDIGVYEKLQAMPETDKVYGRMFDYEVPYVRTNGGEQEKACLISYEQYQFGWARDSLVDGSIEAVMNEPGKVLVISRGDSPWQVGETLSLYPDGNGRTAEIAGILGSCPFESEDGEQIVICSEETFRSITGKNAYTILDVRLKKGNGEKAAVQLRDEALKLGLNFSDSRKDKEETQAIKFSFSVFVYGFLAVILLISVLHIINNINMSVAGRMNQCGVMRAIGMEGKQLLHMVRAEAVVYALFGAAAGILMGLPAHRFVYEQLVTSRWGTAWRVPYGQLMVIVGVTVVTTLLAVRRPARKIKEMDIVDTIHAL